MGELLNLEMKGEMAKVRVIPVIDLKDGQVVRAVAGRRQEYRPIMSQLTPSSCPVEIAEAFRHHFGFTELYLADLNAIAGQEPSWTVYTRLQQLGFRLLLDAGVRSTADALALQSAGVADIVVALETIGGPVAIAEIMRQIGPARTVFSLELDTGRPKGNPAGWKDFTPLGIARQAIELGTQRLIVLDLARVGVGTGPGTENLCCQVRESYPGIEIITGGGISRVADVHRLEGFGVDAILIASALHDGRIRGQDLKS